MPVRRETFGLGIGFLLALALAACSGDVGAFEDRPLDRDANVEDTTAGADGGGGFDSLRSDDTTTLDSTGPADTLGAMDTAVADGASPLDTSGDTMVIDGGCPIGTLKIGGTFVVDVDGHTGTEATTEPKKDANDGKAGDNPFFRRTNVARAHTFGAQYWFTSKHQETGEPDPKGEQYIDYVPPLAKLGAGKYRISAEYRQSDNRADYEALYVVTTASGTTVTIKRDQRLGKDITSFDLGEHDLGCTGFVRVRDSGADSIAFGKMTFEYRGK